MLETIELETGPNPSAAVIWMHGLGADGNDFVPIVNELDLSGAPALSAFAPASRSKRASAGDGETISTASPESSRSTWSIARARKC